GQYLGAEFGIITFQTHHHRHFHADFLDRADDAFGNHVAAHDATEDVDQYGLHVAVGKDDLERLGHPLLGGTTADIKEVGRLAAVQVDDIHGAHGQAGTVDHAA